MSEFDFDELDRAVSSIMKNQGGADRSTATAAASRPTTPSADDANSSELTTSQRDDSIAAPERPDASGLAATASERTPSLADRPVPTRPTSAEEKSDNSGDDQPTVPATPPASGSASRTEFTPKPRGRFMDVVPASTLAKATKAPSRSGNTLQPVNQTVATSPDGPAPVRAVDGISQPPSAAAQPLASRRAAADPSAELQSGQNTDEPDLIAELDFSSLGAATAETEKLESSEDASSLDSGVMDSPFLPDTKVEKRPLGARLETPDVESADATDTTTDTANVDDAAGVDIHAAMSELIEASPADEPVSSEEQVELTSDVAAAELPAELGQEVLSVERDETVAVSANQPAAPEASTATTADSTPSARLVGALPPRQGETKAEVSVDEAPKSSIFDTDDHSPVKQPKHATGRFAVVIIGLMVLVGVISGAVFYLMNNGY